MSDKIRIKRQRILTLDLLRGLFLIIILVDHLAWTPSLLFQFSTAYTGMFASAAEGFFAISGILVGYIYGPRILVNTRRSVAKMWKRGALLYVLAVGLSLAYTAWGSLLNSSHPRIAQGLSDNLQAILEIFTLTSTYGWADFLGRYAVFMFIAPLAVWLIAKRKAWIIIGLSILVWLAFRQTTPVLIFAAWQIIFFISIVIGYYLPTIERYCRSRSNMMTYIRHTAILGIATYLLLFALFALIPLLTSENKSYDGLLGEIFTRINLLRVDILPYFDKTTMAAPRLLLGVLLFTTLYVIFRKWETQINHNTKGILLLFGKYSLFVYCMQSFLLFFMDAIFTPPLHEQPRFIVLNTLISICAVLSIYIATKLYDTYNTNKVSQ